MKTGSTKQNKTLAGKLALKIFLVLLLVFVVMITTISISIRSNLSQREQHTLELLAKENAQVASEFMTTMIDKQEVLISSIRGMQSLEPEVRAKALAGLIGTINKEQRDILSLYYIAEPNTFMPNTPDGFSIFATDAATNTQNERFRYVDKTHYESAVKNGNIVVVDPISKVIDEKTYMVLTVLMPVKNSAGQVTGMVGCNIDTALLDGAAYNNGGYETFRNTVICGHKTVIINSADSSSIGKPYADVSTSKDPARILKAAESGESVTLLDPGTDGKNRYTAYVPFYVGNSQTPWLSGTSISEDEFNKQIIQQVLLMALISALGMAVLVIFTYSAIRRMLKPLAELEGAAHELAQGNLKAKIHHSSNDEMGRVADSLNESFETIALYVQDIDVSMEKMAAGNFDVYPTRAFVGDFKGIEESITNFIRTMCNTLQKMNVSANTVAMDANQVSSSATSLNQGTAEQARAVEELASAIEAMTVHVADNGKNAKLAGDRTQEAGQQLTKSVAKMQDMMQAMTDITTHSQEIGKIIKTIEDIAFQTNILALNAAVEAARAGAAGKGFAVVADEVRNLASKSAEAAKNTTAMIQNSIHAVENGAKIASDAASSLDMVQERAASVMGIVDEICVSSADQEQQIEQIAASSSQISEVIQTNTAMAEESAAASEELAAQAQVMKSLTKQFTLNQALTDFTQT